MKYKPYKHTDGLWYVGFARKNKYRTTVSVKSEREAVELCMLEEMRDNYNRAREIFTKLEKMFPEKYDGCTAGDKTSFGDCVC